MMNQRSAKLGILMLDTRFPRIPGDVGNRATWSFPVEFAIVKGASPQAIVCEDATSFTRAFVGEGQRLIREGCTGLATTCGFLSLVRAQLARELGVPVAASALEQAAQIKALLPAERKVGVLTISKESLSDAHLNAAGVPADTHVVGVEGTEFARSILGDLETLNINLARVELVAAARKLVAEAPETGAILLECTNMVPYAAEIQSATGLPVFSIYSYLNWFHESLVPSRFAQP
ncbi:MAG: aspartate/glutamate racemase family protein [Roseobacter sp.]